jgi:hypothetical protein
VHRRRRDGAAAAGPKDSAESQGGTGWDVCWAGVLGASCHRLACQSERSDSARGEQGDHRLDELLGKAGEMGLMGLDEAGGTLACLLAGLVEARMGAGATLCLLLGRSYTFTFASCCLKMQ